MFVVIKQSWSGGVWQYYVYTSAWATYEAAAAWVASRANPSNYFVTPCLGPMPQTLPGTLTPQTVTVGQFVVILSVVAASGALDLICYGPFTSYAAADNWVSNRAYPGGCAISQVYTAPA
jgi:hypothetical protein